VKALKKATVIEKQLLQQSQSSNFLSQAIKACAAAPTKRNHQALEEVVELAMLIGVNPNKAAYDGGSYSYPVIRAAYFGYTHILRLLVDGGADLSKRERKQNLSHGVVEAAVANNQMLMLEQLLKYELVRREVQKDYGGLALHRAVELHNSKAVELLSATKVRVLEWSIFHCGKFCAHLSECIAVAYEMEGEREAECWDERINWSFPLPFRVTVRLLLGPKQRGTDQLQTHKQLPDETWRKVFKYLDRKSFPSESLEQIRAHTRFQMF
jgi:hypothetical protein